MAKAATEGFAVVPAASKRDRNLQRIRILARIVKVLDEVGEADQLYICSVAVRKETAAIKRRDKK